MDVSHRREIFMKCSEIFMKCCVVIGSFAIDFSGISFSLLFTLNSHFLLQTTSVPSCHLGPKPGWSGYPFLPIHRFISFHKPALPPSTLLPVALLKASATQSSLQATCLGCSQVECRQVSGLRLHLHHAEISITISVSKQHELGCLELGRNTATDSLRWAGGAQAVPQHQAVQDEFPHPLAES